jgi:hypothetical protein
MQHRWTTQMPFLVSLLLSSTLQRLIRRGLGDLRCLGQLRNLGLEICHLGSSSFGLEYQLMSFRRPPLKD